MIIILMANVLQFVTKVTIIIIIIIITWST